MAKDAMAYDTMIDVCARCKQFKVAEELFREMDAAGIEKSIVAYNSMMNACGMCREPHKALQYFGSIPPHLLDQASLANKQVAFQTVMIAMARLGDYAQTRELFMDMTARGIPPSNAHFNALLTSCAQNCQGELAQQVFDLMPRYDVRPDVANWTILISCHRGDLTRCLQTLQEMEAAGIRPSTLTNQEVLKAYILAEDGPGARAFLESKEGRIMQGRALERLRRQAHGLK